MISLIRVFIGLFLSVVMFALVIAGPTQAAESATGKPTIKTLLDNEKVRVQEVRYKPGDVNKSLPGRERVVRYLTDGTFQRTNADGKTEKNEVKAGQVVFRSASEPGQTNKNIGKTDILLYVVMLK